MDFNSYRSINEGSGIKKLLIIVLSSISITMLVSWFSFGVNRVTASQVRLLIEKEAPYVEDRKTIQDSLSRIKIIEDKIDVLREDVARIGAGVKFMKEHLYDK